MTDRTIRARLSMMMALIYAVQGAWWPLLALHLGDLGISGRRRGLIFATYPIAMILTAVGAGSVVDRLMPSQRFLGRSFGLGTLILIGAATGRIATFGPLWVAMLGYWLIVAPSYSIANSIAMRNLDRPFVEFGPVRKWGTVGWMVVGWGVSATMIASGSSRSGGGAYEAFWVAAILSATVAVFARSLPNTPPLARPGGPSGFRIALGLVRNPAIRVYFVVAFGLSLTMPFVYQTMPTYLESIGLPRAWTATALTLGQIPEIIALAGLPWFLGRFGYRVTLGIGIAAWGLRFGSLAVGAPLWAAVAGTSLHGIGIACFTVGGQIFLDAHAPDDRRAGAQATQSLVTSGLGSLVGSLLAGDLTSRLGGNSASIFLIPCLISVGLLGLFLRSFHPDAGSTHGPTSGPHGYRPPPRPGASLARAGSGVGPFAMESADG